MAPSDDELDKRQIEEAIRLSLAEQEPSSLQRSSNHSASQPETVVDLSTESDDDVDVRVISASRKPTRLDKTAELDAEEPQGPVDIRKPQNISPNMFGRRSEAKSGPSHQPVPFDGLDRKSMERERLARLKRKDPVSHSISPPPPRRDRGNGLVKRHTTAADERPDQLSTAETLSTSEAASAARGTPDDNTLSSSSKHESPISASHPVPSARPGIQFRRGTVRKTWAFGFAREQDIKIEEVLQKDDLNIAVLSAFQWDVDWLLSKLTLAKTKMIFVMQAKDESTKLQYRSETAGMPNLRLCFPPMSGNVNCMHSKLQLLFHKDYLRVVVPSANLVPYDWGESGGIMENVVFLIDLPRLPDGVPAVPKESLTFFGKELLSFLEAMGLDIDVIRGILKFDFSATKDVAFVHTIGGSHYGESWKHTGYCGLGKAVRTLGLQHKGPVELDLIASSIGSLNEQFLSTLYLAAQGDDGMTEYRWRNPEQAPPRRKPGTPSGDTQNPGEIELRSRMRDSFRIYFPTREVVLNSRGGAGEAGGTICLQSKWYDAPSFPRGLFRNSECRRQGLLMHSKIIFARPQKTLAVPEAGRAWAYVGSANVSESAWGRLVRDKVTKQPKLNCRNWECGVIVSVPKGVVESTADLGVFRDHVPVPMTYPGKVYGSKRPWFHLEQVQATG